ncbi:cyclophilin-like fold protein [Asanoa siamensis]|uniref:Cyclophilin-like domain-containing protein n=1 Tax=Asanoa siamensis TaxID=926357 RepID=A0ABQ4CTN7_9ACTN|nr:cyclophilin-like fold protein [Asanoa siamensis]GIF74639.1 hypothetical protein Asi02nite_41570 [Asanoa siamensis]
MTATAVLSGCSTLAGPAPDSTLPAAPSGAGVVLRFDGQTVTAALADTPAAQEFTAMLPLTVRLRDVWGQAKSGRLPHTLAVEGAAPIHDPTPGEIYFWPSTEVLAIYYADLGQTVPAPGLVRLGVVNAGLDQLAGAGRQVTVRIERQPPH